MSTGKIDVTVFEGASQIWAGVAKTPLEVGRWQEGDKGPFELQDIGNRFRLVIAPLSSRGIPRKALLIETPAQGTVKVSNIHERLAFQREGMDAPLQPGEVYETREQIVIELPENRTIRIACSEEDELAADNPLLNTNFRNLPKRPDSTLEKIVPARLGEIVSADSSTNRGRLAVDLVRCALAVVRQSAGSDRFYDAAVQSAALMVELDHAMVILLDGDHWTVRAYFETEAEITTLDKDGQVANSPTYSRNILDRMRKTGSTVIYDPSNFLHTAQASLMALDRAVAAPICDESGQVIGALYGDRKFGSRANDTPIGDLEAALLEVMASAVSSGIAREHQETARTTLSQFFSAEVAQHLEENKDLLVGKDAEVTVLFCDIRGFSTISERVGPRKTIEWINDILTELSQCVIRHHGVLVDYIGDELMCMWGAPGVQLNHAELACNAARDMLESIEPLRQRWMELTPEGFGLGIGINTGTARVGNTGSKLKFKYGPLGNTVNLASRVQGITKRLGVSALLTQATANALMDRSGIRKLATVRPVGIVEPVCLYELHVNANANWAILSERYGEALSAFEAGKLRDAAWHLASILQNYPDDYPSLVLLGRVVNRMTDGNTAVDSIWILDSK